MKTKLIKFKSKKEQEAWQRFTDNHIANILQCADLGHFGVAEKTLHEVGEDHKDGMSVVVDHKYLDFEINFYSVLVVPAWEKKNYNKLIHYLCHEIAHVVTEEISAKLVFDKKSESESRFYMERVTEQTGNWLRGLYYHWMRDWDVNKATGESKSLDKFLRQNRKNNIQ